MIIEDEPWAFELIKRYVGRIPFLKMVQTLYDPAETNRLLLNNAADLLFIDINSTSCMELLESLVNKPITVLTSAYKRYAWKGFELGALDYLLKPVDFKSFSRSARRAIELFKLKKGSSSADEGFIFVRSGAGMIRIQLDDVLYIQSFMDYSKVHLSQGGTVIVSMPLKAMLEKLPHEKFIRIHRSYIVAVSQIQYIGKNKIVLFSNVGLPVSRSYKLLAKELANNTDSFQSKPL